MHINVSEGRMNFSQRNNERDPHNACNVTSMVMALAYLDYVFPKGKYDQPEDNLHDHISNNPECVKHYSDFVSKNPWAAGIPPMQIHDILSWCTNHWIGKQVTSFSTNRSTPTIFAELRSGKPIVLSGDFPFVTSKGVRTTLGHIVVLVGAEWNEGNSGNPDRVIIDDPYGNTLNNFQGSGNDVVLSWDQFVKWIKPHNSTAIKWGHFFKNPTEV